MARRFFHVVVVPEDGGEVRNLRIPHSLLRGAAIVLGAVISLSGASLLFHIHTLREARSVRALRAENGALREQIAEFGAAIDDIAAAVERTGRAEQEARMLAGLDPVDEETRKLGIGGPVLEGDPSEAILSPDAREDVGAQARRLDILQRQVSFQRQSYQAVLHTLTENREKLARTPTIPPVRAGYTLSSGFGLRADPFTGSMAQHNGVDFRAIPGTTVIATADGTVGFVGYNGDFGLTVVIRHEEGIETVYSHLQTASVRPSEGIRRGQKIGGVGSTGRTTGSHVHYEVRRNGRPVDPQKYILTPRVIVD